MNRTNVILSYFLYFFLIAFCFPIIYAACKAMGLSVSEDTALSYGFAAETILYGAILLYANRGVIKRDYLENEKTPMRFVGKAVFFSAASLLIGELFSDLIAARFPDAAWSNERSLEAVLAIVPFPLFFFAVCIFGPIAEEFVFRYALQGGIKWKPWNVIFVSLLFGFLHTGFHIEVLAYAASGLCYGVAYEKTKDVNIPIIMHIVNNTVSTLF